MKNTLTLDLRDNPELKTALGGLQPSDSVTLEFVLTVSAVDGDQFEASIDEVSYEAGESGDDVVVEPTADEPTAVVIANVQPSMDEYDDESDT